MFSGFDFNKTLSCSVRDLDVIEVELHATSWVSPNAGGTVSGREADKFDHYEIHSVYFAVDKSYLQNYGFISSIRANYTSAKLTPIVVTRPNVFDELTKNMIVNAVPITGQDVMDLVANRQSGSYSPPDKDYIMGVPYADWLYTEKQNIISEFNGLYSTPVYNRLAYYFENDQIPENFDMGDASYIVGFTSEELEAYFDFQINKGIDLGALCYDMQLNQNIDYTSKDMFDLKTYETNLTGIAKWWFNYFIDDDSYLKENFVTEIKKIQVIDNPSVYSNIPSSHKESVSKDLCINVCDLDAFSKFCKDEVTSDQVVVILRYGIADYRCTGIIDVWEVDGELGNKIVGYSIEKSAFMDVSVAQVAFTSECVTTVIPTASNVVDSYGDGLVFDVVGDLSVDLGDIGDGLSGWLADLFNQLFEKLKVALFIIACIVLIPVFFPIVRGVFRLVTKRKRKNKS